jgi:hypothetical protein
VRERCARAGRTRGRDGDQVHRARFDLVVLVETESVERAEALCASGAWRVLEAHRRG